MNKSALITTGINYANKADAFAANLKQPASDDAYAQFAVAATLSLAFLGVVQQLDSQP